jgi:RES domain-containing protein
MNLFRISSLQHAYDLGGTGAKLYSGRWNRSGNAVIYLAETISLAMLEKMANSEPEFLTKPFSLITLHVPNHLNIEKLHVKDIEQDWKNYPFAPFNIAKGDRWLQNYLTPILHVPGAVNLFENSYLINSNHIDFTGISVAEVKELNFDLRLVH